VRCFKVEFVNLRCAVCELRRESHHMGFRASNGLQEQLERGGRV